MDDQATYGPDHDPEIDMLYAELDFLIHNVNFLQNEPKDEDVVVADEGPTADVEDSLERADMDAPSTVDSPTTVTSCIQKKKRKLDETENDEKAIEADEEVDSK